MSLVKPTLSTADTICTREVGNLSLIVDVSSLGKDNFLSFPCIFSETRFSKLDDLSTICYNGFDNR